MNNHQLEINLWSPHNLSLTVHRYASDRSTPTQNELTRKAEYQVNEIEEQHTKYAPWKVVSSKWLS